MNYSLLLRRGWVYFLPLHATMAFSPIAELFFRNFILSRNLAQSTQEYFVFADTTIFVKLISIISMISAYAVVYVGVSFVDNKNLRRFFGLNVSTRLALFNLVSLLSLAFYFYSFWKLVRSGYSFDAFKFSFLISISIFIYFFYHAVKKLKPIIINVSVGALALFVTFLPLVNDGVINVEGALFVKPDSRSFVSRMTAYFEGSAPVIRADFEEFHDRLVDPKANDQVDRGVIFVSQLDGVLALDARTRVPTKLTGLIYPSSVAPALVGNQLTIRLDGRNVINVCYFRRLAAVDLAGVIETSRGDVSCEEHARRVEFAPANDRRRFLSQYADPAYFEVLSGALALAEDNELRLESLSQKYELTIHDLSPLESSLFLESVRGSYLHHFQALMSGAFKTLETGSLTWNQYGLGPSTLFMFVARVYSLTTFDAIILSTVATNLVVLFFIIVSQARSICREISFVLLGYLFCVSLVMFSSEMIAPGLYFVRVLPHIVLILYLISLINPLSYRSPAKSGLLFAIVSICLLYNFEYGVMLAASIVIAALVVRAWHFLAATTAALLVIGLPVIGSLVGRAGEAAPYWSYIVGIGVPSTTGVTGGLSLIGVVLVCISLIANVNLRHRTASTFVIISLLLFTFISSIKYWWMVSLNHLGVTLFLLMCVFDYLRRAGGSNGRVEVGPRVTQYLCVGVTLGSWMLVGLAFVSYLSFKPNDAVNGYVSNARFSSLRDLDWRYVDVERDFVSLAGIPERQAGLNVIGSFESYLSLRFGKSINGPFFDYNTSSLIRGGTSAMTKFVKERDVESLVIDRSLLDDPVTFLPVSTGVMPTAFDDQSNLDRDRHDLRRLAVRLQSDLGFRICAVNDTFYRLCRRD